MIAQIVDRMVADARQVGRCCARCHSIDLEEIRAESREFLTNEEIAKEVKEFGHSLPLIEWRCGMCGGQFPETLAINVLSGEVCRWSELPAYIRVQHGVYHD